MTGVQTCALPISSSPSWLLYSQVSPSASGGRGLAYGGIFRRDGSLVVSVVQEGLIRPVDPARLSAFYKS